MYGLQHFPRRTHSYTWYTFKNSLRDAEIFGFGFWKRRQHTCQQIIWNIQYMVNFPVFIFVYMQVLHISHFMIQLNKTKDNRYITDYRLSRIWFNLLYCKLFFLWIILYTDGKSINFMSICGLWIVEVHIFVPQIMRWINNSNYI